MVHVVWIEAFIEEWWTENGGDGVVIEAKYGHDCSSGERNGVPNVGRSFVTVYEPVALEWDAVADFTVESVEFDRCVEFLVEGRTFY